MSENPSLDKPSPEAAAPSEDAQTPDTQAYPAYPSSAGATAPPAGYDQPTPDAAYAPPAPPAAYPQADYTQPAPPPPAGYAQPGYPAQQGYGQQPAGMQYGVEQKSKLVAGILGILLGGLGIHNFYLGKTKLALIQLLVSVLSFGILYVPMQIWGLVEGILILVGNDGYRTDARGIPLKD